MKILFSYMSMYQLKRFFSRKTVIISTLSTSLNTVTFWNSSFSWKGSINSCLFVYVSVRLCIHLKLVLLAICSLDFFKKLAQWYLELKASWWWLKHLRAEPPPISKRTGHKSSDRGNKIFQNSRIDNMIKGSCGFKDGSLSL